MVTISVTDQMGLYETSWDRSLDAKIGIDIETGTIFACNHSAETLVSYPKNELIGMPVAALVPDSERELVIQILSCATKERGCAKGFHALRRDGRVVPIRIISSGIIELNGRRAVICELQNISEIEEKEHRLATKHWALKAYAGAALALSQRHSTESLLTAICNAITQESMYVFAWVGLAENDPGKTIRVAAQAGPGTGILDGLHLSWSEADIAGHGPTPVCIRTGEIQIVPAVEELKVYSPWTDRFERFGIQSSVSIPFVIHGRVRGALVVCAATAQAFGTVAIDVFTHLAAQIGSGMRSIEREHMLQAEHDHVVETKQQLVRALTNMVSPMILAMEMRDPYTVGHQARVAEIAVAIAKEMGLSDDRIEGLRMAAQIHDLGKISIPAEILTKPGKLSAAERAMIYDHAEIGYTILKDVPFPWPIAQIVRQHHEKLDGSGYPLGLKGHEILIESKILVVADIVEAMSSFRPYRPSIAIDTVLAHLESLAGTLLDAEAVRVCTKLFREKALPLPGWDAVMLSRPVPSASITASALLSADHSL
jgi:PAS domain S-box-containing protein/putative nucleotidyltransferase with HDIG domain